MGPWLVSLLLLVRFGVALAADDPRPTVHVTTVGQGPTIDGKLDEPEWAQAEPVTDLYRFWPTDGGPPPGHTEFRFLQDARNLYVGVRVTGADYGVRARWNPREDIGDDDQIIVWIDTFQDHRSAYLFYVTPTGQQGDLRISSGFENDAWGTVWRSKGRLTGDGYTVEIAIPFRSLKFPRSHGSEDWGLFVTRWIPATGTTYVFPKTRRSVLTSPFSLSHAATLAGVEPPRRGSGVELIPTLTVLQADSGKQPGEPMHTWGFDPWYDALRPGLEALVGLTPNTGLSVAVNPDFSQVESDDPQLGLNQRFALFRQERREFFLAGLEAFQDQQSTLYTRSVVQPWYGVSVAGREGKVLLGVLQALDRTPTGTIAEEGTPGFELQDVQGKNVSTSFARARVDAFGGGYLGVTLADKRVLGTGAANDVGGLDAQIALPMDTILSVSTLQSLTTDGSASPSWGHSTTARWERPSGQGMGFQLNLSDASRGFRAETGFFPQAGYSEVSGWVDYTIEPRGVIDQLAPTLAVTARTERSGDYLASAGLHQNAIIGGVHNASIGVTATTLREAGVRDDLGLVADASWSAQASRLFSFGLSAAAGTTYHYIDQVPSGTVSGTAQVTLRPTKGLRFDLTGVAQRLTPKGLAPEWEAIGRTRVGWQFSNATGVRVIEELDTGTSWGGGRLSSSFLFTWLLHPGTACYAGYAEARVLGKSGGLTDQLLFAKVSGRIRL